MTASTDGTRPTIVGPRSWPAHGSPPRFTVDTAGGSLYTVELAAAPALMINLVRRAPDNYFHGGDAESTFASGCGWRNPVAVWAHLRRAPVLFYRVVTFDQGSGRCELSVDDLHLDALPRLVVENAQWVTA